MTETSLKKLEVASYLAIIVMALTVSGSFILKELMGQPASPCGTSVERVASPKQAPFGLPGVDWTANHNTLLLVLSADCRFCSESSDFYRRLASDKEITDGVHIVAVFPHPAESGHSFLAAHGISDIPVRQATLWQLGVTGTPTLMLVDDSGKVVESWAGKLNPEEEAAVVSRLKKVSWLQQPQSTTPQ